MNKTTAKSAQLLALHSLNTIAAKYSRSSGFRKLLREFLPYAAIPRADGQHILLNRNYKPLGMPGGTYDYNAPDFLMCSMPIPAEQLDQLDGKPTIDGAGMVRFFYSDSSPPWRSPAALRAYRETLTRALGLLGVEP